MNGEKAIFHFKQALVAGRVVNDVCVHVDGAGFITEVATGTTPQGLVHDGLCLPGMPNAHSHAFQRAMAGLTEIWSGGDDFWSWRSKMYEFLGVLTPDDVRAIATQLYIEMLENGYTSVVEFHYLHHQADGTPYDDKAEMSRAIMAAAEDAGIDLVLAPVFYHQAGFDGAALSGGQKRFYHDVDGFLGLVEALEGAGADLCMAFHSLRAVPADQFKPLLGSFSNGPVHIHIAEQTGEVDECVAHYGARPVEWLMDHVGVDQRWTLVHATHLSDDERVALAKSGAVAGLCPTTEASLGDGLFPIEAYLADGGAFSIGSDSHVSVNAAEELRLLEYGQRLTTRRRAILGDDSCPNVGANLYQRAQAGGVLSMGRSERGLAVGAAANFVVLDHAHMNQSLSNGLQHIDNYVFSNHSPMIKDVYVKGVKQVSDGAHVRKNNALTAYQKTMAALI